MYYYVIIPIIYAYGQRSCKAPQEQQQQQQQPTRLGVPVATSTGLTGNILTVVSFLIGTSSFILGLRIQTEQEKLQQQSRTRT